MDARTRDFAAVRAAMQRYVDREILAGVSWCVLRGRDVVDQQCVGLADREASIALKPDHIFRAFSNTKLLTTCALMLAASASTTELKRCCRSSPTGRC